MMKYVSEMKDVQLMSKVLPSLLSPLISILDQIRFEITEGDGCIMTENVRQIDFLLLL